MEQDKRFLESHSLPELTKQLQDADEANSMTVVNNMTSLFDRIEEIKASANEFCDFIENNERRKISSLKEQLGHLNALLD